MLQEHNLFNTTKSLKTEKILQRRTDLFYKKCLSKKYSNESENCYYPIPSSIIYYSKQLCEALLYSFSGLVLYFGFQHFVFYSAESRTGSGGTKRTSSAGSTGRGGKQENGQIMSSDSSMIQRVIKCCVKVPYCFRLKVTGNDFYE